MEQNESHLHAYLLKCVLHKSVLWQLEIQLESFVKKCLCEKSDNKAIVNKRDTRKEDADGEDKQDEGL